MSIVSYLENGKRFFRKEYQLNGETFYLCAEPHYENPEFIKSEIFRESAAFSMGCDKNEFYEEMDFLINLINGKEMNLQSYWDAYFNLCGEHINNYRRIIDNDLESYLDRILYLMQAVSLFKGMKPITNEEGYKLRDSFRSSSYKVFKDHIYLTKRDLLNLNPLSQYELVKYTDTLE